MSYKNEINTFISYLVLSCACGQPGQEMYPDIADAARTSFCVASDDTALVKIFDWP